MLAKRERREAKGSEGESDLRSGAGVPNSSRSIEAAPARHRAAFVKVRTVARRGMELCG